MRNHISYVEIPENKIPDSWFSKQVKQILDKNLDEEIVLNIERLWRDNEKLTSSTFLTLAIGLNGSEVQALFWFRGSAGLAASVKAHVQ